MKNLLIMHGGGPTAVINASLYGAVQEAKRHPEVGHIYGAIGGSGGLMKEQLRDLRQIPEEELSLLLTTPGSAIGTSRDRLREEEYRRMAEVLRKYEIDCVLLNGGNGTMDTCGKLWHQCKADGMDVRVMGIPKTMDNDIAVTDHAPGYGSAARYIAASVQEVCADVKSLPIHVVIIEASGRNAGWITAASALARVEPGDGPDLIYLPERPFIEEAFLRDVSRLIEKKKGVVVVVSEGLRDEKGEPVAEPVFTSGRDVYFGDVCGHLANLVQQKLGYKARAEKPGLLGRASIAYQSSVDREEARLAGELACRAVLEGETGKMVAFRREEGAAYKVTPILVPIEPVMLEEKKLPDAFINAAGNDVTDAFVRWAAPLIGEPLGRMVSFRNDI